MLKLADKPSCLGGGDKGKSIAQTGLLPNCSVEVRILLLQQKQLLMAAFLFFIGDLVIFPQISFHA
ncbi:MAG: hypothetical protein HWE15_06615 [Algoriphagus sp.]|uniref:hypothetical protein n=1 Tax=Algoriphagus sp. TaxID=1872435 RepID=UPI00181DED80|nr:hypothetical protein [Algoriphagus sp.]NVJ85958.1 hypothetical protein [Algoriphagus sp.]